MNYLLYTRCSSEEQKQGYSHDYQVDCLTHSSKVQGTCLGVYQDSITGRTFNRVNLDKMYKYCLSHRGDVKFVYIHRWDRFGRDVLEAFQTIDKFMKVGVFINCPEFSIDFKDPNWPLLLALQMGMAHSESLKISDRTRDGIHVAMKMGYYPASPPVGFVRARLDKRAYLKPDPLKAPIVAKAFRDIVAGEIAANVFRTVGEKLNIRETNFYHMLRNPVYAGLIFVKAHKEFPACIVPGKHEAIISKETFDKVQEILTYNTRKTTNPTTEAAKLYAKGSIYHPESGSIMVSYYSKGRGKYYPYYEAKGVKGSILNATRVHSVIDSVIQRLAIEIPQNFEAVTRKFFMSKLEGDKMKFVKLEKDLINQQLIKTKLESDYISNKITPDQFSTLHNKVTSEINDLTFKIQEFKTKNVIQEAAFKKFYEHLKNINKIWLNAPENKKSLMLQAIFPEGFYITPQKYELRTTALNKIIFTMCSDSTIWDEIKTDLPQNLETSPVLGGRSGSNRRPLVPQTSALTY